MKLELAVDTETTGLNRWTGDRPFAVSAFDYNSDQEFYWEWRVDPLTRQVSPPEKDKRQIRKLLLDYKFLDFWNAGFDILMLEAVGIEVPWRYYSKRYSYAVSSVREVSFMARACFNNELAFKLKPLAKKYVNIPIDDEQDLREMTIKSRRIAKKLGWDTADDWHADYWIPGELCKRHPDLAKEQGIDGSLNERYATIDAVRTATLSAFYSCGLQEFGKGPTNTYDMEMVLLPDTIDMERKGVTIDGNRVRSARKQCDDKAKEALNTLKKATKNNSFNPNSPIQVRKMLYEGNPLKLKPLGFTSKGAASAAAENLVPYRSEPLVEALLVYRTSSKAVNTFFSKYRKMSTRNERNSLVLHPGYGQWGAKTGRYVCAHPNLQQVSDPTNTNSRVADLVVDIRQTFAPEDDYYWFAPDYDQVEVIIYADISGEQTMLNAIKSGTDIHTATANKVWGGINNARSIPAVNKLFKFSDARDALSDYNKKINDMVDVYPEQAAAWLLDEFEYDIVALELAVGQKTFRKLAKTVTFTKIFGGKHKALMGWLGISLAEAVSVINDYDDSFPDILAKQAEMEAIAKEQGYIENPFGRRLEYDRWKPYVIVNHTVQSSAADLIKRGMIKCNRYLRKIGIDARIVMTIHDEIIFQILKRQATKKVLSKLCRLMSDHEGVFSVPTPASMEQIVNRWSVKKKVLL